MNDGGHGRTLLEDILAYSTAQHSTARNRTVHNTSDVNEYIMPTHLTMITGKSRGSAEDADRGPVSIENRDRLQVVFISFHSVIAYRLIHRFHVAH